MPEDPAQVKSGVVRADIKANDAISEMTERPIAGKPPQADETGGGIIWLV
jgi:hypothetical protein